MTTFLYRRAWRRFRRPVGYYLGGGPALALLGVPGSVRGVDFVYNTAAGDMWQDIIDLLNDTIKMGLSTSVHTADRDDDFLDDGSASDFSSGELTGTGYPAGFGGAGRKTLASKTITVDKANDRAEFDCADITWTGINAGTPDKATALKEITNDAASKTIANITSGGFPVVTNGGDLTFQVNAEGLLQLSTV
jgi:hypothetical protein